MVYFGKTDGWLVIRLEDLDRKRKGNSFAIHFRIILWRSESSEKYLNQRRQNSWQVGNELYIVINIFCLLFQINLSKLFQIVPCSGRLILVFISEIPGSLTSNWIGSWALLRRCKWESRGSEGVYFPCCLWLADHSRRPVLLLRLPV